MPRLSTNSMGNVEGRATVRESADGRRAALPEFNGLRHRTDPRRAAPAALQTITPFPDRPMSPVNRRITGAAIKLSLPGEALVVKEQLAVGKDRAARTLIKHG